MHAIRRAASLLMLCALGCGGDDLVLPPNTGPVQVMMIQGDHQEGATGAPLPDSLRVRLVDTLGNGVAGREVSWVVALGGGSIAPETDTSDADGYASAEWTLGQEAGANAARAVLPEAGFVTFTAVASKGKSGGGGGAGGATPSPDRSSVSATPDSIAVGSASSTITVTVRDAQGHPVAGAVVSLATSGAGNTLTQPPGPTGADGVAQGTVVGTESGVIVVTATVNGSVPLNQTAQVTVTGGGTSVTHLVFRLQPPHDVAVGEQMRLEVALADANDNVVPLTGILLYLGLFSEPGDVTTNKRLIGNRFVATDSGVAVFELGVNTPGSYVFRALTDQLPELGPHGPEPYLFSLPFNVH
jgi:Invasin, domain 3